MDRSVVSEYDNISTARDYSGSVLYQAINNVLSVSTVNGNRMFCPLCAATYQFKFELQDHLRRSHFAFLCRAEDEDLLFEECPFCYAKFVGRHTVIRHVLRIHCKLIAQLYGKVEKDSNKSECIFCKEHFGKKSAAIFATHIEDSHFLQFISVFEEQFLKTVDSFLSPEKSIHKNEASVLKNNCFDFSSMKQQLCDVKCKKNLVDENVSGLKPNLKWKKTKLDTSSADDKIKVRRILHFDISPENKENSVLAQNINSLKQITTAEHSLLCCNNTKEQMHLFNDALLSIPSLNAEPLHSSTPKSNLCKNVEGTCYLDLNYKKETQKRIKVKVKKKPTFKSYCCRKEGLFQCGKCKKIFQENIDLNCHIKKNHKLFIINLLHPCYQCAICKTKFYKNYYLKKHIKLHSSYKDSLKNSLLFTQCF